MSDMSVDELDDILKNHHYDFLSKYTHPVKYAERKIVGRDKEMRSILAAFERPELCNVILLAEAGCGKTALVQGTMAQDNARIYLEVDLARMLAELTGEAVAGGIKSLFDDAERFVHTEKHELVLFMDEFHQIVQLSAAAVEAMKPMLADSGTRGIRVIAATTYTEFRKYISDNQPLVERLMRINLPEPDEDMTVSILKGMAKHYGVENDFYDDHVYHLIYQYTNRYVPANAQPRKSILILDAMVGWHRAFGRPMDYNLLADIIYDTEGVNVAFKVDATTIKRRLDERVLAQKYASAAIENRMQICVAGLNNPTRPMASLLFTGSTGVGKLLSDDTPVPIFKDVDGKCKYYKRHGDLKSGDIIFDADGKPTEVIAVFPHYDVPMYRVTFKDGRFLDTGDAHLWAVYNSKQCTAARKGDKVEPSVMSTLELNELGCSKYYITMNKAVEWDVNEDIHLDKLEEEFNDAFLYGSRSDMDGLFEKYSVGSIEQRWAFIHYLFDNHGFVSSNGGAIYDTISRNQALSIQKILFSLGIISSIRKTDDNMFIINVEPSYDDKIKMFTNKDKIKDVKAKLKNIERPYKVRRDFVGIKSIKFIGNNKRSQCILVDNPDHLYQAGDFVVTHNTEMTKQLAEILFHDERALLRFDMTEYANPDSLERFRDSLTTRVWEHPYSIILLDEIEKACAPVTRLLLQVLDDGRLSDRNGRETSFVNAYIILTTNAASEIYSVVAKYGEDDEGSGQAMARYDKIIRNSIATTTGDNRFPPELLGRIDTIVPFQPLSEMTQMRITKMKLDKLRKEIKQKHNIEVRFDRRVIDYLVKDHGDTDSNAGGARAVVSKLESEVTTNIAKFINKHPNISPINVRVRGITAYDDKYKLQSNAYIEVTAAG